MTWMAPRLFLHPPPPSNYHTNFVILAFFLPSIGALCRPPLVFRFRFSILFGCPQVFCINLNRKLTGQSDPYCKLILAISIQLQSGGHLLAVGVLLESPNGAKGKPKGAQVGPRYVNVPTLRALCSHVTGSGLGPVGCSPLRSVKKQLQGAT